jgi:hypothetical protein
MKPTVMERIVDALMDVLIGSFALVVIIMLPQLVEWLAG